MVPKTYFGPYIAAPFSQSKAACNNCGAPKPLVPVLQPSSPWAPKIREPCNSDMRLVYVS